jgi:acetyl-CoA carboxylase biotin carboxyl carrier protein
LDLKELKEILQILDEKDITEFELEEEGIKLRIRKASANASGHPVAPVPIVSAALSPLSSLAMSPVAPAAGDSASPVAAPAATPGPAPVEEGLHILKSPIVGTFYRARDPQSPPFAQVGDRVKVGQILCIIEAMKMMNEIEAEVAGEIVRVMPDNGQPVQYGDPLFAIRS